MKPAHSHTASGGSSVARDETPGNLRPWEESQDSINNASSFSSSPWVLPGFFYVLVIPKLVSLKELSFKAQLLWVQILDVAID